MPIRTTHGPSIKRSVAAMAGWLALTLSPWQGPLQQGMVDASLVATASAQSTVTAASKERPTRKRNSLLSRWRELRQSRAQEGVSGAAVATSPPPPVQPPSPPSPPPQTAPIVTAPAPATPPPPSPTVTVKTDLGVYPEPTLLALPQAGSKVVDPTFGTSILRLTDGSDGNRGAGSMYSYWPAFNRDNSYVVVREELNYPRAKFFPFDPATFSVGAGFLLSAPPPGLQEYSLLWSGIDPLVTYGITLKEIWSINVQTQRPALVKDLSAHLPAGGSMMQPSKSLDDDVFAMSVVGLSGAVQGYVVWKRSTDQILLRNVTVSNMDEVHVDKSGRWLIVGFKTGDNEVWNLQADPPAKTALSFQGGTGFFHYGTGQETVFTGGPNNGLAMRSLANPLSIRSLIPGKWSYAGQQDHFSFLADNELWGLGSRYSINGGPVVNPLDNEIVQVATDGSQRVRRLAHHRSVILNNAYDPTPKASISRDGRFVLFTSNWGQPNGRFDAYIVAIPPAPTQ